MVVREKELLLFILDCSIRHLYYLFINKYSSKSKLNLLNQFTNIERLISKMSSLWLGASILEIKIGILHIPSTHFIVILS